MNSNESRGVIIESITLKNSFKSVAQRQYPDSPVRGGTFSDFELAWLCNGPLLKIIDVADGTVVSSWDFTTITHDSRTVITSIIEYSVPESSNRGPYREGQLHFIVSYTSKRDSNKASYVSVCHPRTSRVLHTITTKETITCLDLICLRKDHSSPISGVVKSMYGAIAAGTKNGNILIIDIKEIFSCVRQGSSGDRIQNRFSEMIILDSKQSEHIIRDKLNKVDDLHHVAVLLSNKKDDKDSDSEITTLSYIPQCTMLAVGLKSGAFQLWDMCTLKRLHKSTISGVQTPVVRFGFQEPCNDPQSFCYLWVLHESQNEKSSCLPFAIMYACLFKKMVTIPDYGRHYKNFVHCKKRFDLDVDLERCVSGRCIACSVVSNTPSNMLRHVTTVEEDASKINLFVVAFETWEQENSCNSCITLIIFDMNQWYKAQMPQLIYQGYSVPFVNSQVLDHVSERKGTILDMRIKKDTIQQFLSFNLCEEYSYPSSLSFDTLFLTDLKLVHVKIPGAQRNVLDKIVAEGPSGIINPSKYYSECKEVGLRPCFSDTFSHVVMPSQLQQRNYILTVLLEQKLSSFLVSCVKHWADGSRGVSGCTLPNLIRWAWECVTRIKQLTDTICVPLYDYSGDDLDRENYQKLKHCVQLMHTIKDLLAHMLKNYKQYILEDIKLKHQVDTLKLITKYFDIIIWCLDSNLLPEKVISSSENCVPTYMMSLMQFTEQRREELHNIVIKDKYFATDNTTLYIIDSILEHESTGKKLRAQWERESGGLSTGLYPPVTLQSLLRMFLVPDLSDDTKHFIMIYFLLDVCDYHRDEDMKEQLLSFSVIFSIDSSFFSLVKACWLIDHEKYEDAAGLLLKDSVMTQLKNRREIYRTMMLACVCQAQYQFALRIERLIKLSSTIFKGDTFYITLLLLNGLVMEAYATLKENIFKVKELLRHFFKVCDNLGYLKEIFKFPLTSEEEEEFLNYLDACDNKDAGDLKVMYLLSRARYVEAIDVNHQLSLVAPKFGIVGQDTIKQKEGIGRTTTRDLLVNAFSKTLPAVTNDLIDFCRKEKNKIARFKTVAKPTPLSVIVHTDMSHQIPVYRSSFESVMEAAINKTAETWKNVPEILKHKRAQLNLKNTPFLRSDFVTPRKNATSFSERVKCDTIETKKSKPHPDEPVTKRQKLSSFVAEDTNLFETSINDQMKQEPPSEVTNILRTPHVQKRLNKLLQSTPESSPLISILKSAESRYKQPQKVGFNVPETESKQIRKSVITSPASSTMETIKERRADLLSEQLNRSYTSPTATSVSMNESLNTSTSAALDSFYSLDSDSDSNTPNLTDFVRESSVLTHTSRSSIESKNEEQTPKSVRTPLKFVIECMSEEETPEAVRTPSTFVIECMSEEETPQPQQLSTNESTIEKEIKEDSHSVQVEIHAPPVTFDDDNQMMEIDNAPMVCETSVGQESGYEDEKVSFTALKPLKETPLRNETLYQRYETNEDKSSKDESNISFREEFSIVSYERETVLEQSPQITQTTLNEIQDTSSDDSDIEVVAESLPSRRIEDKNEEDDDNDLSTEMNDNSSDRTYESDYSYSQESIRSKSDDEDELQEIEIEDQEASTEEEAEEEAEGGSQKIEELSDEEEDEYGEEEENDISTATSDIDCDSLKQIMSTVKANETKQEKRSESISVSPSVENNEGGTSCEVVEVMSSTSVIEESIVLDSTFGSPVSRDQSGMTVDQSIIDAIKQSQDVSVEMMSVSCIEKDKSTEELPMVFYFGENSVTSIAEEQNITIGMAEEIVGEVSQKTEDFVPVMVNDEKNESVTKTEDDKTGSPKTQSLREENIVSETTEFTEPAPMFETVSPTRDNIREQAHLSPSMAPESERISSSRESPKLQLSSILPREVEISCDTVSKRSPDRQTFMKVDDHIFAGRSSPSKSPETFATAEKQHSSVQASQTDDAPANDVTTHSSPLGTSDSILVISSNTVQQSSIEDGSAVQKTEPHLSSSGPKAAVASTESPIKKPESECSFTMSIPDSPRSTPPRDVPHEPTPTPTPSRRSARIARKRSMESIPEVVSAESTPIRVRTKRKIDVDSAANTDNDDAMSVKSDISVAESVNSRASSVASTKSNSRKRSLSKMEMRKSSLKPKFKQLEVIMSDEEEEKEADLPASHKIENEMNNASEDERCSSVSEASTVNSRTRKDSSSSSKLNVAVMKTPSPTLRKTRPRKFAISTPIVSNKNVPESSVAVDPDYKNYADSRRLTRHQKSLLEYGITRLPPSTSEPTVASTNIEANIEDDPLGSKLDGNADQICDKVQQIKQPKLGRRASTRLLKTNKSEAVAAAGADSSDDSVDSKVSTASRQSRSSRRSSYTKLELRKSSIKPQFKPLAVIPSDEDSIPRTPRKSFADDESIQSSPCSVRSQTTRSMLRAQSELSDMESSQSDVSGNSNSKIVRRTRRSATVQELNKRVTLERKAVLEDSSVEKRIRSRKAVQSEPKTQKRKR